MSTYNGNDGVARFATSSCKIEEAGGTASTNTVQINTVSAHGLSTGDYVVVTNVSGFEDATYENPNGVFEVTVVDTDSFTFTFPCDDVSLTQQDDAYVFKSEDTIAEVKSFTAVESTELTDDTAMGDAWRTKKIGLKSWEATIECHWDDTDAANSVEVGSSIGVMLYPEGFVDSTKVLSGHGKVTSVSNTQTFENQTVSRTITATGTGAFAQNTISV